MNNDKDRKEQPRQQNPTLNAPGSKVADYGNPDGGSGNDTAEQESNSTPQIDERTSGSKEETIGNP